MGMTAMIEQRPWRRGVEVMVQPTANAPPVDTQFGGDVGEGTASVQVQQSQRTPQNSSVMGFVQLLTQAETLLRGQVEVTQGSSPWGRANPGEQRLSSLQQRKTNLSCKCEKRPGKTGVVIVISPQEASPEINQTCPGTQDKAIQELASSEQRLRKWDI
jgi:hypothetical protein